VSDDTKTMESNTLDMNEDIYTCEMCEGTGRRLVGYGPDQDEVDCTECAIEMDPDTRDR
jgi:hypothetical protein